MVFVCLILVFFFWCFDSGVPIRLIHGSTKKFKCTLYVCISKKIYIKKKCLSLNIFKLYRNFKISIGKLYIVIVIFLPFWFNPQWRIFLVVININIIKQIWNSKNEFSIPLRIDAKDCDTFADLKWTFPKSWFSESRLLKSWLLKRLTIKISTSQKADCQNPTKSMQPFGGILTVYYFFFKTSILSVILI